MSEMKIQYGLRVNEAESQKFFEKVGAKSRFECLSNSFGIGKIRINFQTFEQNNGSFKQTGRIGFYLDFMKAIELITDYNSGKIEKLYIADREKEEKAKAANQNYYPGKLWTSGPTGTNSKRQAQMAANGKAVDRKGAAEYREFYISRGVKTPFVFTCIACDGKENDRGLIVPLKDANKRNQNETRINIGFDGPSIKEFVYAIDKEMISYRAAQYVLASLKDIIEANTARLEEVIKSVGVLTGAQPKEIDKIQVAQPVKVVEKIETDVPAENVKPVTTNDVVEDPIGALEITDDDLPF